MVTIEPVIQGCSLTAAVDTMMDHFASNRIQIDTRTATNAWKNRKRNYDKHRKCSITKQYNVSENMDVLTAKPKWTNAMRSTYGNQRKKIVQSTKNKIKENISATMAMIPSSDSSAADRYTIHNKVMRANGSNNLNVFPTRNKTKQIKAMCYTKYVLFSSSLSIRFMHCSFLAQILNQMSSCSK
eukprot:53943_1